MNMIVKSAVAGALALGSTGAFAISVPSLGTSDLILIVQNLTTPANVYALDTGITLNTIFPSGSFVTGAALVQNASGPLAGITNTIAESSTLQAFLAANPVSGDVWTLMGAQYPGGSSNAGATNGNSKAVGNMKTVFSSIANPLNIVQTTLASGELYSTGINNDLQSSGNYAPLLTTLQSSTGVTCNSSCQGKYALTGGVDLEPLGSTAMPIYALTGNGNTTSAMQSYILGSATLSAAGVLKFSQNPSAVPLPPAVWLFGSGLLGLVGVSRRRKSAA